MSHVFVVHGDLTKLACDAWLLPTDSEVRVTAGWLRDAPDKFKERLDCKKLELLKCADWRGGKKRAVCVGPWSPDDSRGERAAPCDAWLVNVGAYAGKPIEWYAQGVSEFVKRASDDARAKNDTQARWRSKPLLALPLVGR